MHLRRKLATVFAALTVAPLIAVVLPASPASAHGWVTNPPSRQDHCATRRVANCGDIQYEPQSVEAPKGSMKCSGGSRYTVLDNDGMGWPVTSIGSSTTVTWKLTAAHRTTTWVYYVDGRYHQEFNQGNSQPPFSVSHQLSGLPSGRHKILAVWNISDTPMAFYACMDVQIGGGGGGGGDCGSAWSSSAIYTKDAVVSHRSTKWRAKWWTQGEEPGTTGQWGVWENLGGC